jgi:hypothetical protein
MDYLLLSSWHHHHPPSVNMRKVRYQPVTEGCNTSLPDLKQHDVNTVPFSHQSVTSLIVNKEVY